MRYDEPILNATQESDPRVRWRAWRMWLAEGRPEGRELDYLLRARELQAIDDNPAATRLPDAVLQQVQAVQNVAEGGTGGERRRGDFCFGRAR